MNLEKITLQVAELSKNIGIYLREQHNTISNNDIERKGLHDLVTYVDKESEQRIIRQLRGIIPQAGIIAEEDKSQVKAEKYNWIIDPLDGTTNFVHGIPIFSISIALIENDELLSGVVYEVVRDECFYAWKNGGAFLNGNQIHVSKTSLLDNALLATGFPYSDFSLLGSYMNLLQEMMKKTRGIRRLGSAAVDLAYVACGRFDVFFEYGLNSWDVAAGALIVKEAGGKVSDFKLDYNFLFGRQIIAANPNVYDEFMKNLQNHFPL